MRIILLLFITNILLGSLDCQSNYLISNDKEGINLNSGNWGEYDDSFEFSSNWSYISYHSKYNVSVQGRYTWYTYYDNGYGFDIIYNCPRLFKTDNLLNKFSLSYDNFYKFTLLDALSITAKRNYILVDFIIALEYHFEDADFIGYTIFSIEFDTPVRPLLPYISVWMSHTLPDIFDNNVWVGVGFNIPLEFK